MMTQTHGEGVFLPPEMYMTPGLEGRIYFDNLINIAEPYSVGVESLHGTVGDGYWSFIPEIEDEGVSLFSITYLDAAGKVLAEGTSRILVTPPPEETPPPRILVIGDSLTQGGTYQRQLGQHLEAAGIAYETIGTDLSQGFAYEGKGGYTYQKYMTDPESPFVFPNDGFDLERYFLETASGQLPTLCIVFLGINDTFGGSGRLASQQTILLDRVLEQSEAFIAALKETAPGTDVAIVLTPAGNSDPVVYERLYGANGITPEDWQSMQLQLVARYIHVYGGREGDGIHLIPASVVMDRRADYRYSDAVHVQGSGLRKIGDTIYAWLVYYLNKAAYSHWALERFSVATIAAGEALITGNPDGDSFSNGLEYQFNLDPHQPTRSFFTLTPEGLSFNHLRGKQILIEHSTDFRIWEQWEGPGELMVDEYYMERFIPLSAIEDQFFRVAY